MYYDNEKEIASAIGASSLANLSEAELEKLVEIFSRVAPELQLSLIQTNPALQDFALKAISAVEDDLRATLTAMNANTREAFAALSEIREIIAGELGKGDLSAERWRLLIDLLIQNGQLAVAVQDEANRLVREQANAARRAKLASAAMPYVDVVLQVGVRLLITKGRL